MFSNIGNKTRIPTLTDFFQQVSEVQATETRQVKKKKKKNRRSLHWKGKSEIVFAGNTILYLENPTDATQNC